jgi:Flp pilus assembly protein TadB
MFCYRERKHIYLGFFAAVFAWIFWVIICALIAILVTIIFIIPMYVFSVVSLCRMAYWWRKNKRLNKKDLTKE